MIGTAIQIIAYLGKYASDNKKRFEVKEKREKRSLSQNSYYWTLLGQVAKVTRIPAAKIHNGNLRALSLPERIEGKLVTVTLPDTDEAEDQISNSETYHLKPTSQVLNGRGGVLYRTYILLRGSSTFNTEEMSALLDLMIQEAETQGVDTLTPIERERMKQYELQKQTRKSN